MADFNQAVGLTDDPVDAIKDGNNKQKSASDAAMKLQREQYEYQKSLSDPFFKASLPSYYSLVDAITGQRQTYADPNYTKLSADDIRAENYRDLQSRRNSKDAMFGRYSDKDLTKALDRNPTLLAYDPTKTYYRDPQGNITTQPPPMMQSQAFNPTETDAYKWQQSQMEKNTGRTLRSLGRANSTYGMNVMADSNKNLAASEYDKQLSRLADLTNIARGGSSSLASASAGFSTGAGNNLTQQGNNAANASLGIGMANQNKMYNSQQSMNSLANLGLKIYDMNRNSGGDNSGGWGSYNGTVDNYDANTTYAGDSAGPWAG